MYTEVSMIRTTNSIQKANLITHGGVFQADDVMATVILEKVFGDVTVCRVLEVPEKLNSNVIVYDIGGGKWDHHQKGGNGARKNGSKIGVPYAAAGLIWRDFGYEAIKKHFPNTNLYEVWNSVDKMLIQGVDATDNGVNNTSSQEVAAMSICQMISNYNPTWDDETDYDEAFLNACNIAREILWNIVKKSVSTCKAKKFVKEAIEQSSNHIMVLQHFVPWQRYLYLSTNPKAMDIWFVIYPSLRGGYNWQTVTTDLKKRIPMKPVPEEWCGLKGKELQKITGVNTAIFCHDGGFVGSAKTIQDAIKMAQLAIAS